MGQRIGFRRTKRSIPLGVDAPLWLNLIWIAAFGLAVAIGVRVAQTGWRLGLVEIAFVATSIAALIGSIVAAERRENRRRR